MRRLMLAPPGSKNLNLAGSARWLPPFERHPRFEIRADALDRSRSLKLCSKSVQTAHWRKPGWPATVTEFEQTTQNPEKERVVRIAYILLAMLLMLAAPLAADELTTTDGDKLVGTFEKLENGEVYFTTKSAGAVKVPVAKVASLSLDTTRKARIRTGDDIKAQQEAELSTRDGKLVVKLEAGELDVESLAGLKGID